MNRHHQQQHRHAQHRPQRQQFREAPRGQDYDDDDRIENFQQFSDDYYADRNFGRGSDRHYEPRRFGYGRQQNTVAPTPPRGYPESAGYSRAYSGNREAPYGADQRYFENYGAAAWGEDRDRSRGEWRGNAFDDGSYLGDDWRDRSGEGARNWLSDESRRVAGVDDPRGISHLSGYGTPGSRPYGQQGLYGRQTPKGYTRSDERIKDDVCEHLYHANDIDLSDVSIETRNGTLILEGTVPERRMKHRIEDIAEQCIGVSDVENRIRVSRGESFRAQGQDNAGARGDARKSGASPSKH